MAHDLRSPLQALDNLSFSVEACRELLESHPEWSIQDPKVGRVLKSLKKFEQLSSQIIKETNHYLDMTLMKFVQEPLKDHVLKPTFIREALDFYRETYPFRVYSEGVKESDKIHLNIKDNFVFNGEKNILYRVLAELTQNAFQAIRVAGKGEIFITAESRPVGEIFNILSFKDTGSGMSSEVLRHCFEPFYSKAGYGMGMGLFFCQKSMLALGGSIECESIEGDSTTVTLKFPK
jgi:two-component system CAI-1 autoinducer sensor kinase/phosphatase CqsS